MSVAPVLGPVGAAVAPLSAYAGYWLDTSGRRDEARHQRVPGYDVEEVDAVAFELFTRSMVPLTHAPYVTVQKRGTISMNRAAHHAVGDPEAVELLFDREVGKMGFRAVDPANEHAYAIRATGGRTDESGTYVVSATAFCKYFNIDTSVSRRWPATLEDGVLVLDMTKEGTVVTSNRNGRPKDRVEADPAD